MFFFKKFIFKINYKKVSLQYVLLLIIPYIISFFFLNQLFFQDISIVGLAFLATRLHNYIIHLFHNTKKWMLKLIIVIK